MVLFNLFLSQDEKAKISHLKNLVSAGFADGLINKDEFLTIVEIMKREGIDRNAIEYYINHFKYIHFVEPTTVETKRTYLKDLIHFMTVYDGHISNERLDLYSMIATLYGFDSETSEVILKEKLNKDKQ